MSRKRERVQVTLSPAVMALVEELAEVSGESRSGVVLGMLETVYPAFREHLTVMRKLEATPAAARELVESYAATAQNQISQAVLGLDEPKKKRGRPRRGAA